MTPLHATTANDLIGELNNLREQGNFIRKGELAWTQISKKIQKLMTVDAAQGWHVQGILYAATGDVAQMEYSFANASRLDSGINIKRNLFASYASLGLATKGLELYLVIGAPEFGVFTQIILSALSVGAFQAVNKNLKSAQKMGIDMDGLPVQLISESASVLARAGISDQMVARHIDAVGAVLTAHNSLVPKEPVLLSNDIENVNSCVTLVFRVHGDAKTIFSYNVELAKMEEEMNVEKSHAFDVVFAAA